MRQIALTQLVIAAMIFVLCAGLLPKRANAETIWYQRQGRTIKRRGGGFDWWDASFFALLYYFALPWFIWRFGWWRTLLLLALPYLISVPIVMALAQTAMPGESMFLNAIGVGIMRALVGCWVGFSSWQWRHGALLMRGWTVSVEPQLEKKSNWKFWSRPKKERSTQATIETPADTSSLGIKIRRALLPKVHGANAGGVGSTEERNA